MHCPWVGARSRPPTSIPHHPIPPSSLSHTSISFLNSSLGSYHPLTPFNQLISARKSSFDSPSRFGYRAQNGYAMVSSCRCLCIATARWRLAGRTRGRRRRWELVRGITVGEKVVDECTSTSGRPDKPPRILQRSTLLSFQRPSNGRTMTLSSILYHLQRIRTIR